MKRFFAAMMILSVLASACQNELQDLTGGKVDIEVEASAPDLDKTYLGTWGEQPNTILWGKDESLSLAVLSTDGKTFLGLADSDPASDFDGTTTARFRFSLTVLSADSYLYTGVYPASAADWSSNDARNTRVTLPGVQHSCENSYDPQSFIMIAKPEVFSSRVTKWTASFRRATAINVLTLTNLPEGVVSVKIEAPGKHLSGERCVDVTTGLSCELPSDETGVTAFLPSASTGSTVKLWLCTWGATIAQGETLTVTASTASKAYTRSITASQKGIVFREGTINTLSVNMKDATPSDIEPVFEKFEGTQILPGVKNAIVISGIFDPAIDDVKLTLQGGDIEPVASEFKKITNDRIEIYTHILRIDQRIKYHLVRNNKTYDLTTKFVQVLQPTLDEGYVPDAQCRNMLRAERKIYGQGGGDGGGLGVPEMVDVCEMVDAEAAAAFTCEDPLQITGWGFKSIEGLCLFDNIGKLAWDQPYLVMWGNGNLEEADFSTFNGHYDVNLSSCANLTKVVAGPNMGGFWNLSNCPKLRTVDISRSNRVTDLQMAEKVAALRLVDLRYQPGGFSMASAGNINLQGLASNSNPSQLVIKINREYFIRHNDSRGWKDGVYAAWKKGATVMVYEFGDNDKLLGEVPAYALRSDALSPENGKQLSDGTWVSVNGWSPDEDVNKYWERDYSGKIGFQTGTLPTGETGILLGGKPVYMFGVNCFSLLTQVYTSGDHSTKSMEETVECLASANVPIVRCGVMPYDWNDFHYYLDDKAGFLSKLDYLASLCDQKHILLLPSFFWYFYTLPYYYGENGTAWGDKNSSTHKMMLSFTTDVVNTLKGHKCLAAWEFGNEYNLDVDLGMILGHEQIPCTAVQTAYKAFAELITSLDTRGRIICSGNSMMRNSQWHQYHKNNWNTDSYAEYKEMTSLLTPDPMKGISEHIYYNDPEFKRKFSDKGDCSFAQQLQYAKQCARELNKVLYVGEFTGPNSNGSSSAIVEEHFKNLYEQKVQLSMIWGLSLTGDVQCTFAADSPEADFAFSKIREYNGKFRELMK